MCLYIYTPRVGFFFRQREKNKKKRGKIAGDHVLVFAPPLLSLLNFHPPFFLHLRIQTVEGARMFDTSSIHVLPDCVKHQPVDLVCDTPHCGNTKLCRKAATARKTSAACVRHHTDACSERIRKTGAYSVEGVEDFLCRMALSPQNDSTKRNRLSRRQDSNNDVQVKQPTPAPKLRCVARACPPAVALLEETHSLRLLLCRVQLFQQDLRQFLPARSVPQAQVFTEATEQRVFCKGKRQSVCHNALRPRIITRIVRGTWHCRQCSLALHRSLHKSVPDLLLLFCLCFLLRVVEGRFAWSEIFGHLFRMWSTRRVAELEDTVPAQ
eukprot:Rhum_TRINITY_DN14766_c9_g2::Rhum_TRINITY_DN14766_c9_g2_i1::g.115077::m.115077